MYYIGKKIDTFEMAMVQLLESAGYPCVKYIDCISRRSFGYRIGDEMKNWFCPAVKTDQAVRYIAEETGLKVNCIKAEVTEDITRLCNQYKAVLIGPVRNGIAAPLMKDYYYNGDGRYLIISEDKFGGYKVSDPQGIPELHMTKSEIEKFIIETYVVFADNMARVQQPEERYILKQGMEYRREIQETERRELMEAVGAYCGGRSQQTSLAYALMNLTLQMDKVFLLADDVGILSKEMAQEYIMLKQRLYRSGQQEALGGIPEIIENVWRVLENAGI